MIIKSIPGGTVEEFKEIYFFRGEAHIRGIKNNAESR
jgi:hypothetical protein